MKSKHLIFVTSVMAAIEAGAQLANPEAASAPVIAERGPHHAVWRTVYHEPGPKGRLMERTRTYTELATGMHYLKDGQWEPSREEKVNPTRQP